MFRFSVCLLYSLLFAVCLRAQTTFVRDSFSDTNGTLLESHAPDTGGAWTRVRGDGLKIQSGSIRADKTGALDVYTNAAVPPAAEYVIGLTVTFTKNFSENYIELYARRSGTTHYSIFLDAQDHYALVRTSGGVATTLASGTTTATNPLGSSNEVLFSVTNGQKRLIVNGTVVATTTDNTITSAGVVGVGLSVKTKDDVIATDFYGSTLAPTAVELDTLSATRDAHRTLLTWTTGQQSHNLGYRIWRDGVCLTPTPIAGSAFFVNAPSLASGTSYRFVDEHAEADARYWLEELDVRGTREWHGPLVASVGKIDSHTLPTPKLSELTTGVAMRSSRFVTDADTIASPPANNFDLAASDAWKIAVTTRGIQEIALPPDVDMERLQLFEDGVEIPIALTATTLRFFGKPLDTATSGTRTYWLRVGESAGMRVPLDSLKHELPQHTASGFLATVELRDKRIFDATLTSTQGDGFFGPVITEDASFPATQTLRLEQIDRTAPTAELTVTLQGATAFEHRVGITINGVEINDEIAFANREKKTSTFTIDAALLRDGDNEFAFVARNGAEDVSAVELVRVTYSHRYVATDGTLLFTAPGGTKVSIGALQDNPIAFDITDPASPQQIAVFGDSIAMPVGGTRTVLVTTTLETPARVEANIPSMLHALQRGSVVIIAPRAFHEALAPLAALRGATLVDIDDVYDEYTFGAKDPYAIRAFLDEVRPRAVLLVGDGSYDPRDFVGGAALDLIPVHFVESALQRTPSDAWFTDFDDDGAADIPIGRLPARDAGEAQAMVEKILAYERDDAPSRNVVYVRGTGGFAAQRSALSTTDIDIADEGVVAARENLLQRWASGVGVIDFGGHGSVEMWEGGGFFSTADAASMTNEHLPLVIAMTCLNGYFHDLMQQSLAESLLRNANGGAAAVWAFSTLTETAGQLEANDALLLALKSGKTLGEATQLAQRATVDPDVRRTLLLFGDPLMKMNGRDVRRRAVR